MDTSAEAAEVVKALTVADGVEHHLDPRAVAVQRIGSWIFTGVVMVGLTTALVPTLLFARMPVWGKLLMTLGWLAIGAGLAWVSHQWPAIVHRHSSYRVDSQGIEIKHGVVWRRVINVPRSRVQHTDVSQGPIERGFQLGTLVIYTAGTEHAKVDLHGLEYGRALLIRDHLLQSQDADDV
jgi:uncharacterized protein